MTRDQLSPAQKAASQWVPGFFDRLGWGLGMAVVTGPDDSAAPGSYGWDGGLGTVWRTDPRAEVLVRDDLDDIGEVLALDRELDHIAVDDLADRNAPR